MDHSSVKEREDVALVRQPTEPVETVSEELEFDREMLNDYLTMRHRS